VFWPSAVVSFGEAMATVGEHDCGWGVLRLRGKWLVCQDRVSQRRRCGSKEYDSDGESLSAVPWQSSRPWTPEPSRVISAEQSACTTRHQAKIRGCYCGLRAAYESFAERPQDLVERLASSLVVPGVFFVPSFALRWLRHRSFAQPKRSSIEQRELHHHTAK
jgi:hypothetical protein